MKLLTFGLFIAAITLQISAIEIVEEREDGKEDLESRIDMELEEERVQDLDVESRELDAKQCPCEIYTVKASGWQYYNNRKLEVFSGKFKKKYSNNGDLGRQYDVIWEDAVTGNVIAGLNGVWEMGKWSGRRLSEKFVRVNTGRSEDNICPDAGALKNKWTYRSNTKTYYSIANGKRKWIRQCNKWRRGRCKKRVWVLINPVIKVTCTKRESRSTRQFNINNLKSFTTTPRPSNQSSKNANPFGRRPTTNKNKRRNNFGGFQNTRHHSYGRG